MGVRLSLALWPCVIALPADPTPLALRHGAGGSGRANAQRFFDFASQPRHRMDVAYAEASLSGYLEYILR